MQMVWLSSKTTVPKATAEALDRERLYELLQKNHSKRITILQAPAGYGKTTLLSQWFNQTNDTVTWISLNTSDNDPIRFWKYVIHTTSNITESNMYNTLASLFQSQDPSTLEFLIDSFLNEMSLMERPISIVLEDYHLIDNKVIHQMLTQLIEYLPDNVHVYVTSRENLPLPIAKWRVKSWLNEISMEQLCFTFEEIEQFYEKKNLEEKLLHHVLNTTEGWPAGIQLTSISMRTNSNNALTLDKMNPLQPLITDFLLQEILDTLPSSIQDFLLKTSFLQSLEPEICNSLTNRSDSYAMLIELENKGIFTVRLNNAQPMFRYHHLFAEALQIELKNRYPKEFVSSIILETAKLLYLKGDINSAIDLALQEGAFTLAESWITEHLVEIFKNGETSTFLGWIQTLRRNDYPVNYEILVMYTITLISALQLEEAGLIIYELELKQQLEQWMDKEENKGIADIFTTLQVYALISMGTGIEKAIEIIQRQVDQGYVSSRWDGIPIRFNLFEHKITRTSIGSKGRFMSLEKAIPFAKLFRETEFKEKNMTLFSYGASAETLYERNYIDAAIGELEIALKYGHSLKDPGLFIPMYVLKSQIYALNKNFVAAHALLDNVLDSINDKHWQSILLTMKARCFLLEGNTLRAEAELRKAESRQPFWLLVHARLLLATAKVEEALKTVIQVKTKAIEEDQVSTIVEASLLEAICEMEMDHKDSALNALHEALSYGSTYDYVRTFLDEEGSIKLLKAYTKERQKHKKTGWNSVPLSYVERLIESSSQAESSILDQLTPRELEVFQLLVDGATNKEIAQKLFLSEGTIRVYLTTIYSKLGVKSRAKAILLYNQKFL
ncbi:LuxR C-terminal-related transcriptional regulator [uncultured Psychrobacillus sp.]|uniref:LuxR C-terminal-related transcriptional regulator n=1 Tax=uncultured Psychrobacillus sp. TaxID=1551585 RepID=UPI0026244DD3|nr:LuxR C-terminal-related transcriptional regulator [uncultured Psychrobacillus sp.]